jgi:phenylpropionate dioxygenase-like ring-hydroxylating dioxygenase large terminal subunit
MFLAHLNDLAVNDYKPLGQYNKKTTLVKTKDRVFMNSNVCPHQFSMLSDKQGSGDRVCPYHNWTFDINGNPVNSGRTLHICENKKPLVEMSIYEFKNMFFNKELACPELAWLDLSKMQLKEERVDFVKADPKIIMDVFLDVDHIEAVHTGVYDKIGFSNIDRVKWHYYDWGTVQMVSKEQECGAIWLSVYPGTMIEWQQGALFITVATACEGGANVHVFKYSDTEDSWQLNEEVWETAWAQDKELAERIVSFGNKHLEESKQHFRNWLNLNKQL